ncbi:MAG TPA: 3D domain-containing protein [Symbiobacteriaceae bacterium]|nr:3D domain-containing protein [Symbiobacteriaceae bacterium]
MQLAALLLAAVLVGHPGGGPVAAEQGMPAFDGEPRHRQMTATAYTAGPESTGKRPGHPAYGLTATGTRAQPGKTIAVDPRVIPLGSKVYIDDLGEFIAEDTGGAIHGDRVDLYMESVDEALDWGVRKVRLHVTPKI